jgi:Sulfotransferase domain
LIYQDEPVTFLNIEERVPEIYFNSDHRMRGLRRPRILKSHECFQPHYPSIIYIVRDPRDVAVSFYHHNLKARNIPDQYPMDDFVPRFLAAEFDRKWGTWADHVQSWLLMRQEDPRFILVRYEDMKADCEKQLLRIADFLRQRSFRKIDSSPEKLRQAVELSSPERMRKLEKEQSGEWALTKSTRSDKPFVRSATAGKWKSALSPVSVTEIEGAWGSLMQQLGYELSHVRSETPAHSARE